MKKFLNQKYYKILKIIYKINYFNKKI